MKNTNKEIIVILDNIRSAYNVGSIFRTADAVGIKKLFLIGQTATPIDRFGRGRKDIAKVALGAEKTIKWKYYKDVKEVIKTLKNNGFEIVAVEQDNEAIDYKDFNLNKKDKIAFVFGNEIGGILKETLDICNYIIHIPMSGKKESLNVAVSFGIIVFEFKP